MDRFHYYRPRKKRTDMRKTCTTSFELARISKKRLKKIFSNSKSACWAVFRIVNYSQLYSLFCNPLVPTLYNLKYGKNTVFHTFRLEYLSNLTYRVNSEPGFGFSASKSFGKVRSCFWFRNLSACVILSYVFLFQNIVSAHYTFFTINLMD